MKMRSSKRTAAALLAFVLAAQMSAPALAADTTTPSSDPAVVVTEDSHFKFHLKTNGGTVKADSFDSDEEGFWSEDETGYCFNAPDPDAESAILPDCQRAGYRFLGWKLKVDTSEQHTIVFKAGETVQKVNLEEAAGSSDIVMEAQWQAVLELNTVDVKAEKTEIEFGTKATLTATAELGEDTNTAFGDLVKLDYQWMECKDENGNDPVAIDNATSAEYQMCGTEAVGEHYFICKVVASMEDADQVEIVSKPVTIKVVPILYTFQFKEEKLTKAFNAADNVFQLDWTVRRGNADMPLPETTNVAFASDNENVATVDENGQVTINGIGSAVLTAQLSDDTGHFAFTANPVSMQLSVKKGQSLQFEQSELKTVYGSGEVENKLNGAATNVTYKSSNENIAKVDINGKVTIVGTGTAVITGTAEETDEFASASTSYKLVIANADISGISVAGYSGVYDGSTHDAVIVSGTRDGDTVLYSTDNENTWTASVPRVRDVSESGLNIKVKVSRPNHNDFVSETVSPEVSKATCDMSGVHFNNETVTYDGTAHSLTISGELPDGVTVSYEGNGNIDAGTYQVIASFHTSSNYNSIEPMIATQSIERATYDMSSVRLDSETVTYDGHPHQLSLSGVLPAGVTANLSGGNKTDAGEYTVTASFSGSSNYKPINDITGTLKIVKATYDMTGVQFADNTVTYDGKAHSIEITGQLPSGVSVSYEGNEQTDAGVTEVKAQFKGSNNYNSIPDMIAKLIIQKQTAKIAIQPLTAGAVFGGRSIKLGYQYGGTGAITATAGGNAKVELDPKSRVITITPAANGKLDLKIDAAESKNFTKASTVYSISVDKISSAITSSIQNAIITVEQNGEVIEPNGTHYVLQFGKQFTYTVSAPGYVTKSKSLLATSLNYEVELDPAKYDVVFNTGNTRSVQIVVKDKNGRTMEADESGVYHLTYGKSYDYTVSAPGMNEKSGDLTVSGSTTVNVQLDGKAPTIVEVDPNVTSTESEDAANAPDTTTPANEVEAVDADDHERNEALEAVEEKIEGYEEQPSSASLVPDNVTRTSAVPVAAKVLAIVGLIAAVVCGVFAILTMRQKHESNFEQNIAAAKAANAETQKFEPISNDYEVIDDNK